MTLIKDLFFIPHFLTIFTLIMTIVGRTKRKLKTYCGKIFQWIWKIYSLTKLTFISLFYNEFANMYYIGDSCLEPLFWIVDHFTKILGPICVIAVILFFSSLVVIAYAIGLPFYLRQNVIVLLFALFVGHWLLINVVFYYYMAYITSPGYPPKGVMITEAATICKRCIAPKPPRTHHCVACNRCILKMDHHCPWLNNCVGHFNHRYFFMFCAYTWIGVVFVILLGIPVFYCQFSSTCEKYEFLPCFINLVQTTTFQVIPKLLFWKKAEAFEESLLPNNSWTEALYHSCIIYAAILCVATLFLLGGLTAWHARLITNGETSVESHINKAERKRFLKEGKVYTNPYDYGAIKNWKIFLRVGCSRSWWHLLIPFVEKPAGDGLKWNIPNLKETDCDFNAEDSFNIKIA